MESEFLTLHESLSWATSQAGAGRGRPCPAGSSPVPSAPVPRPPPAPPRPVTWAGGESPYYLSARSSGQSFPKSGAFFIK